MFNSFKKNKELIILYSFEDYKTWIHSFISFFAILINSQMCQQLDKHKSTKVLDCLLTHKNKSFANKSAINLKEKWVSYRTCMHK